MLNILATAEKKKILDEYRLRLATVAIFALGMLVLASSVLLAPSYFLAVAKYNDAQGTLAILEGNDKLGGQEKDVNATVQALNKNIDLFLKVSTVGTLVPSVVITKILDIKGGAIKVVGFTYDATPGQERIVVTGVARSRDALAQFIDTLKKDTMFTSVDIPISSYVKSSNIDFSAVIMRKTKK